MGDLAEVVRVYAYGDDCVDDFGWGCTYRNIQTVLHAASARQGEPRASTFDAIFDKCTAERDAYGYDRLASSTVDDRWIEPHQAGRYLHDEHQMSSYEVLLASDEPPGKCLSCTDIAVYQQEGNSVLRPREDTAHVLQLLSTHLQQCGWVIVDNGQYSYSFLAGRGEAEELEVLVGDPHRQRPDSDAGGPVGQLMAMGFSGNVCGAALRLCAENLEDALNLLLVDMPKCVAAVAANDSEEAVAAREEQHARLLEELANLEPSKPSWRLAMDFLKLGDDGACNWALLFVNP